MTNTMRKTVALMLTLVLALSTMTVVSLAAEERMIGYGLSGSSYQDVNMLRTTTTVRTNPDNAYLRTSFKTSDGISNYIDEGSKTSARGALSLKYDPAIYFHIDGIPTIAFCSHEVRGGTTMMAEVQYTTADISIS